MMRQTRLNIRWRLTIWNALAFAFILVAFGIGVYQLLRQTHFDMLDKSLKSRLVILEKSLRDAASADEAIRLWVGDFGEHSDYFAMVCDSHKNILAATVPLGAAEIHLLAEGLVDDLGGTVYHSALGRMHYLSREVEIRDQTLRIVVLAELAHLDEELWLVRKTFLWAIPPALVLSAALSYWLAVRALSPVEQLRLKTDSISATDLQERIAIANADDEIGQLAATINSLLARLDESFDEIKRFTADASHELRTPIAIIRSEAEMGLQNSDVGSRTAMRLSSIVEECGRLTNLSTQLLALSRAEASINRSNLGSIRIDRLLADVVDALEPLARQTQVRIQFQRGDTPCSVKGDYDSLRQVFHNLIDNAIKYNVVGGIVEIVAASDDQNTVVSVHDSGRGIVSEHLPRIFERFFRSDSEYAANSSTSSQQSIQGSGLGLSIARRIINNHGGTCEVESELGKGTLFRVILPKG